MKLVPLLLLELEKKNGVSYLMKLINNNQLFYSFNTNELYS